MRRPSTLVFCTALFASGLLGGCAAHHGYHGRPTRQASNTKPDAVNGLHVVGRGKVDVAPDLARVRFGVQERGATATDASNAVQNKMRAVIVALKQAGVPSEQIQTRRLNLRENHEYRYRKMRAIESGAAPGPALEKPAPDRYIANHTVELDLTDLARVGAVLAAVQNAGVNEIDSVQFQVQDPEPVLAQAREKAIKDAQAKAQAIAGQAGVALGQVEYISTLSSGGPDYYEFDSHRGMRGVQASAKMGAAETPISPGQLSFEQQIFMRFSIDKSAKRPAPAPQK